MDGDLLAEPGMEIDLTLTIHQDHVALAGSHEAQAKVESENDVALTIPNIDSTPSRPQSYWGLQIMRRVGAARCVEEKDGSRTGTRLLVRQRAAPWHKKLVYATRLGADRQTGSAVFGLHCKLSTLPEQLASGKTSGSSESYSPGGGGREGQRIRSNPASSS
jgi:hypothetical protein